MPYSALNDSGLTLLGAMAWNFKSMGVGDDTLPGSFGVSTSINGASFDGDDLGLICTGALLDACISSGVTKKAGEANAAVPTAMPRVKRIFFIAVL